jgi:hypothetical protein
MAERKRKRKHKHKRRSVVIEEVGVPFFGGGFRGDDDDEGIRRRGFGRGFERGGAGRGMMRGGGRGGKR